MERIKQYVEIEQEPSPTESGKPPAYWPSSGSIRVENLSARYSKDGPDVLQDVTFEIQSGERVGVGEYQLIVAVESFDLIYGLKLAVPALGSHLSAWPSSA